MSTRLTEAPAPPKDLSKHGRAEWRRIAPLAIRNAEVTDADLPALALLAEALGTVSMLRAVIEKEGATMETAHGGRKAHPGLRAAAEARAQAMRLLAQFRMTPHSRSLGKPPAPSKADRPFSRLRRGLRAHGGAQ